MPYSHGNTQIESRTMIQELGSREIILNKRINLAVLIRNLILGTSLHDQLILELYFSANKLSHLGHGNAFWEGNIL